VAFTLLTGGSLVLRRNVEAWRLPSAEQDFVLAGAAGVGMLLTVLHLLLGSTLMESLFEVVMFAGFIAADVMHLLQGVSPLEVSQVVLCTAGISAAWVSRGVCSVPSAIAVGSANLAVPVLATWTTDNDRWSVWSSVASGLGMYIIVAVQSGVLARRGRKGCSVDLCMLAAENLQACVAIISSEGKLLRCSDSWRSTVGQTAKSRNPAAGARICLLRQSCGGTS